MPDEIIDPGIDRRLDLWAAGKLSAELSPGIEQKIQSKLQPSLKPVRPLQPPARLAVELLVVFSAGALALVAVMSKSGLHLLRPMQIALMAAILLVDAIPFSFTLAWRMIPASRQRFPLTLALALAGSSLAAGMGLLFSWRSPQGFISEGWPCALMEGLIAIPAFAVFWLFARRGALFPSAGLGAGLAALAGLLALAVQQAQCMFPHAPHLLVWHLGTALLVIAFGAVIGVGSDRWWGS